METQILKKNNRKIVFERSLKRLVVSLCTAYAPVNSYDRCKQSWTSWDHVGEYELKSSVIRFG